MIRTFATRRTLPILDYSHSNGRCSITGGYVYHGSQGALPDGTYVDADYCTGEIFTWDGSTQSVALDTPFNISSFGEDEHGELYVVGLGGTVSRIVSTSPCTYSIELSLGWRNWKRYGDSRSRMRVDGGFRLVVDPRDVWREWKR